ncbi:lipopolysaccharide biosynthesis protein [Duganella violaceipulchra]|uniref:Lipopolysaccharide biosynthesis protein n=1 Tax=Duganella violaceipulchra TaxID=2849652 RepID=A0AA41L3K6_9BURK|nr:lipopolysaccharide biosynthesis protein [Duganella violaceicalia]MBV6321864.1 lipopolysaccharide biosynthesis protein [Duganella violaceicalia]MCP2007142.1 O-antigen/teichoic acid export membrane protein [Duganella violaceicalia]
MQPRMSFLVSFAEKYTLLLVNTAGTMILARLLTPAEIGVYAVGAVLVGLAQAVRDFGVGPYVIQEKQLNEQKLRAALGTSILVAWSLALVVLLSSGVAARFYRDPRLSSVLQLLSINFLLIPFSSLALPCLRRQMRFSAIFAINTASSSVQLLVSVGLAWLGHSYLSLVWGAVAGTAAGLLASVCCWPSGLPWLPARRGMAAILSFGTISTAGSVIDELGVAAPDLIVGKLIGVAEVGIFGKAQGVLNVFNQLVTSAISPVIFPLFSDQARAGGDLRQAYLTTASYVTVLAWPFFGFVAISAPAVVRLLYGAQWDACVPLIRIMCLSSALYSMFSMARYLFVAMGAVRTQAKLDALSAPVRVLAVLLAAPLGLEWVAWAVVLGGVFRSIWTFRYLRQLAALQAGALLGALRRSALVALSSLSGPLLLFAWHPLTPERALYQLSMAGLLALPLWLAAILLFQHELAAECTLAGRKVWARLVK